MPTDKVSIMKNHAENCGYKKVVGQRRDSPLGYSRFFHKLPSALQEKFIGSVTAFMGYLVSLYRNVFPCS